MQDDPRDEDARDEQDRAEPRTVLGVEGPTLRQPGGSPLGVTLHDLSRHGFSTEWPYSLLMGALVWLKIPGLEALESKVVWQKQFRVGCRFTHPLHPAVFKKIVERLSGQ